LSVQGTIDAYLKAVPDHGWPDWVVGGHDKRRVASRIGPAQARILAMLLLTLRGTPFFFAGDEIGMTDVSIPPECVQDVFEQRVRGYGLNRRSRALAHALGQQRKRRLHLGPPMAANGRRRRRANVARLQQDPRSLLWLYRSLIRLRKQEKALTAGSYVPMRSRNDVLMFKRSYGDTELLVALNFSHDPCKLPFDPTADLLISTHLDREPGVVQSSLILRGDEGVILRVSERRT
jgi:alpha-glucosidase